MKNRKTWQDLKSCQALINKRQKNLALSSLSKALTDKADNLAPS